LDEVLNKSRTAVSCAAEDGVGVHIESNKNVECENKKYNLEMLYNSSLNF
jgi:hypothetical protein